MTKHPLFWGLLIFFVALAGWWISIIFSVITLGHFRVITNAFGHFALWILPVTAVWEFILWIKRKK